MEEQREIEVYRQIAHQFMLERYGHLTDPCQMRCLAAEVFEKAAQDFTSEISLARKYGGPYGHFRDFVDVLKDACSFLESLREKLNPSASDTAFRKDCLEKLRQLYPSLNPEQFISFIDLRVGAQDDFDSLKDIFMHGRKSNHYWPIYNSDFKDTVNVYLNRPWIHCTGIDKIFIRNMLYETVIKLGERLDGKSINPYSKDSSKHEIKAIAWTIFRYIAGGVVGLGAAIDHGWWAGILATTGFIVLSGIYIHLNNKKREEDRTANALQDLTYAFIKAGYNQLSLIYLRELLARLNNAPIFLPDLIFSILDNAISRGQILLGHDR